VFTLESDRFDPRIGTIAAPVTNSTSSIILNIISNHWFFKYDVKCLAITTRIDASGLWYKFSTDYESDNVVGLYHMACKVENSLITQV
jgi:hypothetical protein